MSPVQRQSTSVSWLSNGWDEREEDQSHCGYASWRGVFWGQTTTNPVKHISSPIKNTAGRNKSPNHNQFIAQFQLIRNVIKTNFGLLCSLLLITFCDSVSKNWQKKKRLCTYIHLYISKVMIHHTFSLVVISINHNSGNSSTVERRKYYNSNIPWQTFVDRED